MNAIVKEFRSEGTFYRTNLAGTPFLYSGQVKISDGSPDLCL